MLHRNSSFSASSLSKAQGPQPSRNIKRKTVNYGLVIPCKPASTTDENLEGPQEHWEPHPTSRTIANSQCLDKSKSNDLDSMKRQSLSLTEVGSLNIHKSSYLNDQHDEKLGITPARSVVSLGRMSVSDPDRKLTIEELVEKLANAEAACKEWKRKFHKAEHDNRKTAEEYAVKLKKIEETYNADVESLKLAHTEKSAQISRSIQEMAIANEAFRLQLNSHGIEPITAVPMALTSFGISLQNECRTFIEQHYTKSMNDTLHSASMVTTVLNSIEDSTAAIAHECSLLKFNYAQALAEKRTIGEHDVCRKTSESARSYTDWNGARRQSIPLEKYRDDLAAPFNEESKDSVPGTEIQSESRKRVSGFLASVGVEEGMVARTLSRLRKGKRGLKSGHGAQSDEFHTNTNESPIEEETFTNSSNTSTVVEDKAKVIPPQSPVSKLPPRPLPKLPLDDVWEATMAQAAAGIPRPAVRRRKTIDSTHERVVTKSEATSPIWTTSTGELSQDMDPSPMEHIPYSPRKRSTMRQEAEYANEVDGPGSHLHNSEKQGASDHPPRTHDLPSDGISGKLKFDISADQVDEPLLEIHRSESPSAHIPPSISFLSFSSRPSSPLLLSPQESLTTLYQKPTTSHPTDVTIPAPEISEELGGDFKSEMLKLLDNF